MRQTVTISLGKATRKELDAVAKREGVSRSDVIRESLRDFLFVRNFLRLREAMMAKGQHQGGLYRPGCF